MAGDSEAVGVFAAAASAGRTAESAAASGGPTETGVFAATAAGDSKAMTRGKLPIDFATFDAGVVEDASSVLPEVDTAIAV